MFHNLMWEDKGGDDGSRENSGRRRSDLIDGEIQRETSIPLDYCILRYCPSGYLVLPKGMSEHYISLSFFHLK